MSCRGILLAASIAILVTASSAHASWLVRADAGLAIPTGTFSDLWSPGFLGGVGASYLLTPRFAAGVDASYASLGTTSDYQALLDFIDPGASDGFTLLQLGAHGEYMIPVGSTTRFAPYVVAGLGLYRVKDTYDSPTNADALTQTAFGIRGGLGCDYWVSPTVGLGVEADYNDVFTNEDDIGFGSTPHFAIRAGVRWKPGSAKQPSGRP